MSVYKILYFRLENCEWNVAQEKEFSKQAIAIPIKAVNADSETEITEGYKVTNLPTMVLIDGNGLELNRWIGTTSSKVINNYLFDNGYVVKPDNYIDDITRHLSKSVEADLQSQFSFERKSGQFDYAPQNHFSDDIFIQNFQLQYKHYCLQTKGFYASDMKSEIGNSDEIKQAVRDYFDEPDNRLSKAMRHLYECPISEDLTHYIGDLVFYSIIKGCENYEDLPIDVFKEAISPQRVSVIIGMYIYFLLIANDNIKPSDFNKLFVDIWMRYFETSIIKPLMFRMRGSKIDEDFEDVLVFPK